MLKELKVLCTKLDDKRYLARIFNHLKDYFCNRLIEDGRADKAIYEKQKEQIEILVRLLECTNKITIDDFIQVVINQDFQGPKHYKENNVIFDGVSHTIRILLKKETNAADLKVKQMLSENGEYKKNLYSVLNANKKVWNLILFYFKDTNYDNLPISEKLLPMVKYAPEDSLIRAVKNVQSKDINDDLVKQMCAKLNDKALKAFLEEKY